MKYFYILTILISLSCTHNKSTNNELKAIEISKFHLELEMVAEYSGFDCYYNSCEPINVLKTGLKSAKSAEGYNEWYFTTPKKFNSNEAVDELSEIILRIKLSNNKLENKGELIGYWREYFIYNLYSKKLMQNDLGEMARAKIISNLKITNEAPYGSTKLLLQLIKVKFKKSGRD